MRLNPDQLAANYPSPLVLAVDVKTLSGKVAGIGRLREAYWNYPSNNNHVAENAHIHIDMLLSEGSKVHLDIYHSHVCIYSERNNRRPLAQLGAF